MLRRIVMLFRRLDDGLDEILMGVLRSRIARSPRGLALAVFALLGLLALITPWLGTHGS